MPVAKRGTRGALASLFGSDRKQTALDSVIEKIKELLKNGGLRPGSRLPNETELAKAFGASRGTVREAVKILESYGVLEVKWGDGTFVCDSLGTRIFDPGLFRIIVTPRDKRHLLELRRIIEGGLSELAAENALEEDFAEIERRHRELGEMIDNGVTDAEILGEADARFHLAIGRATHNPLVEKIYSLALELYYPSIVATQGNRRDRGELLQTQQVHQDIVDALRRRDKEAAKQAVIAALDTWLKHL